MALDPKMRCQSKYQLDLDDALEMTLELIEGFRDPDFQRRLHEAWDATAGNQIEWLKARQPICLEVQGPIIRKYGFEPTRRGDLIFYQGIWKHRPESRQKIVHVEVFLGYQNGEDTVGSLNSSACPRTWGRSGVQQFENYRCEETDMFKVTKSWFCSLQPWLQYSQENFAHAKELADVLGRVENDRRKAAFITKVYGSAEHLLHRR
eukprot:TRINITY_DN88127_c0_g1_i1.p1 TRINITY_DN88127_c0_g1~~TRINITY_DN88127_c0_g1_i1.p1  ORF type:complete len:215 (+),score=31.24 TRINITY_DN88127_c0_g1_i1:28-645(+)